MHALKQFWSERAPRERAILMLGGFLLLAVVGSAGDEIGNAVAGQADGKIVVAGITNVYRCAGIEIPGGRDS